MKSGLIMVLLLLLSVSVLTASGRLEPPKETTLGLGTILIDKEEVAVSHDSIVIVSCQKLAEMPGKIVLNLPDNNRDKDKLKRNHSRRNQSMKRGIVRIRSDPY